MKKRTKRKLRDGARSGDVGAKSKSSKLKRKRFDPRQSKPEFKPFTEEWGLRGNRWWEKPLDMQQGFHQPSWELIRASEGAYLHPFLFQQVFGLQWALESGDFPYRSNPHPLGITSPHAIEFSEAKIQKRHEERETGSD